MSTYISKSIMTVTMKFLLIIALLFQVASIVSAQAPDDLVDGDESSRPMPVPMPEGEYPEFPDCIPMFDGMLLEELELPEGFELPEDIVPCDPEDFPMPPMPEWEDGEYPEFPDCIIIFDDMMPEGEELPEGVEICDLEDFPIPPMPEWEDGEHPEWENGEKPERPEWHDDCDTVDDTDEVMPAGIPVPEGEDVDPIMPEEDEMPCYPDDEEYPEHPEYPDGEKPEWDDEDHSDWEKPDWDDEDHSDWEKPERPEWHDDCDTIDEDDDMVIEPAGRPMPPEGEGEEVDSTEEDEMPCYPEEWDGEKPEWDDEDHSDWEKPDWDDEDHSDWEKPERPEWHDDCDTIDDTTDEVMPEGIPVPEGEPTDEIPTDEEEVDPTEEDDEEMPCHSGHGEYPEELPWMDDEMPWEHDDFPWEDEMLYDPSNLDELFAQLEAILAEIQSEIEMSRDEFGGVFDRFAEHHDHDNDGKPEKYDDDDDNDGVLDVDDEFPINKNEHRDTDKDGRGDHEDDDDDNDFIKDLFDIDDDNDGELDIDEEGATFEVDKDRAGRGSHFVFKGHGFKANALVEIFVDGEYVQSAEADENGSFEFVAVDESSTEDSFEVSAAVEDTTTPATTLFITDDAPVTVSPSGAIAVPLTDAVTPTAVSGVQMSTQAIGTTSISMMIVGLGVVTATATRKKEG